MSTTLPQIRENRTLQGKKISERMQRLIETAERDSNRRDFEIVREMRGLPPKNALKKPK